MQITTPPSALSTSENFAQWRDKINGGIQSLNDLNSFLTYQMPDAAPALNLMPEYFFDSRVAFTRNSAASAFDAAGNMITVPAGKSRVDWDPLTGRFRGRLMEVSRTNLLLNSAVLGNQSVTVSAVQCALSFYGTGTINLSGAYTGSLVGTGEYPNRASLIFTPTAGSLVISVTGDVQYAQLENCGASPYVSSWIPTTSSTATRSAESASIPTSLFGYNQKEGTFVVEGEFYSDNFAWSMLLNANDGTANNSIGIWKGNIGTRVLTAAAIIGGVTQGFATLYNGNMPIGAPIRIACGYKQNNFMAAVNGNATITMSSGNIPTVSQLDIGHRIGALATCGSVRQLLYYPKCFTAAEIQALSAL